MKHLITIAHNSNNEPRVTEVTINRNSNYSQVTNATLRNVHSTNRKVAMMEANERVNNSVINTIDFRALRKSGGLRKQSQKIVIGENGGYIGTDKDGNQFHTWDYEESIGE